MSAHQPAAAGFAHRVMAVLGVLQSAVAASAAVRNGRRPEAHDLVRLGIDPAAFTSLGHG